MNLTDDHIRHMVTRFLAWKIPDNFSPDAGISFTPMHSKPSGTNLFDANQAESMIRHMVIGLNDPQ